MTENDLPLVVSLSVKIAVDIHAHADGMARRMPRGIGVKGTWPCPVCGKIDGIRWWIAKPRLHLWARCTTENCINIVE